MTTPVTVMDEVPVVSEAERQALIASLKDAEAEIAAGRFITYDPDTFKDRLLAAYRAARAAKGK